MGEKCSPIDGFSMFTSPKPRFFLYQIFYNEETRSALDGGFIPLDNMENWRPDWFEFWVIRNFLKSNQLDNNSWYGFLSPKFGTKTGLSSDFVLKVLDRLPPDFEVALFSPFIDHLAYYQNPFVQMDRYHPGLLRLSQDFFDMRGLNVNLESLVTCLSNSVFSNYVVAKPSFWSCWLAVADFFLISSRTERGRMLLFVGALCPTGTCKCPPRFSSRNDLRR